MGSPIIIFDLGDTLVKDRSRDPQLKKLLAKLPRQQKREYEQAIIESEAGKLSYPGFLPIARKLVFPNKTLAWVEDYYMKAGVMPTWPLAGKLSKSYQIIILSNNHYGWVARQSKKLGINLKKFPFVNSAFLGIRKPDPRIYEYALKKYKVSPKQAIYIDDRPENLIPAKKLGMKTFHYTGNMQKLKKFLRLNTIKVN